MSCYHPLKGFPIGISSETGKTQYKVTSYDVDHLEMIEQDKWIQAPDDYVSPYAYHVVKDFVQIPCGQCVGCRLDYSREWANRCLMELEYHPESWFVTLTYDDDHIPWSEAVNKETGEITKHQTLVKKDFQDFMKRLRKNYATKYPDAPPLRFYACGEYGSQSFRPHFHAIIYGLHLDDLSFYKRTELGDILYNSSFLDDCWHHQGYAVVGSVTWESCAYVARYIMKKLKGDAAQFYEEMNITPEFTLMSRKPGIAKQWYLDHPGIYDFEFIHISTPRGGKAIMPPRYFDKLYDVEYPGEMAAIKENRKKFAEETTRRKMAECSYSYLQMLYVEEQEKKARIKSLTRRI